MLWFIATASLLSFTFPALADTILTYSETFAVESRQKSGERAHEVEISLGAGGARYKDPHQVLLLDAAASQLVLVDPAAKHYSVVAHPMRLEDQAASESEKRAITLFMDPRIEIDDAGEVEKFGHWEARRYRIAVYDRDVRQDITIWLSTETVVSAAEAERLRGLFLDHAAMRPPARLWMEKVFEHGGVPVRLEESMRLDAGASISARTRTRTLLLLSVEEQDVAPEVYRAPAEYERRPFDLSRYFGVKVNTF